METSAEPFQATEQTGWLRGFAGPSAVPMMMRAASSMFCSYFENWIPPLGPTEKGNLKPTPRKLVMVLALLSGGL